MPLPKNFPRSPYAILSPSDRWTPGKGESQLYEKLLPPLVHKLREGVKIWRDNNYAGASNTSRALLRWWFETEHPATTGDALRYYFAQREAVETVIYLYDAKKTKDKYDLLRYDSSGNLTTGMFPEEWLRLVIKMATGSGKTKVISLLMAWSYFHKMYEENSTLARNFLLVTPNIIVLDRLRTDFEGLKIFHQDPILPDNGYEGQNWRDDFQLTVRIQDDISAVRKTGNLFLTNIHRIYSGKDHIPGVSDDDTTDYFMGGKGVAKTGDSKVNLADIVRDIDELTVFNDEAHHIHDERLAWSKSIEDINHRMKGKGTSLSLQVDVTATPKHNNGIIFAQTVSDYPLVEAIYQHIVKHPVLPDDESLAKLKIKPTIKYTDKYGDYIRLGYIEWKKVYDEYLKMGKKAVLFVMTDDTKNCDDVAAYLKKLPGLSGKDAVLTIHTKNNGEISEASTGKNEKELQKLRKAATEIDDFDNPYKAIVSVLMLKEGWDVKNVTTIVGLRAYSAESNILPEQTLGRGLRRMFGRENSDGEIVSVIGTKEFMNFVKSIQEEGVVLGRSKMGEISKPQMGLLIEVDKDNLDKNIAELDMTIPLLTPRMFRDYKELSKLDFSIFDYEKLPIIQFTEEEMRNIVFYHLVGGEISHQTPLDGESEGLPTYREILSHYAQEIMKGIGLFSEYDILFDKLKKFTSEWLFVEKVDLEEPNILRNLSEPQAAKTIIETFIKAINALTMKEKDEAQIKEHLRLSNTRPFIAKRREFIAPQKSIFNKIVGDNSLELEFAGFLEDCPDILSFAKNYFAVNFRVDYVAADGHIRNYHPDFLVKISEREIYIVETKGREDINDAEKFRRLRQWCEDVNAAQNETKFSALYVKQEMYEKYRPKNFAEALTVFQRETPGETN